MRRLILALLLVASVFTAKAQYSDAFEAKADAFLNQVESSLSTATDFNSVNWSAIFTQADLLLRDPEFASQWNNYVTDESFERFAAPVGCVGTAIGGYAGCTSYYAQMCHTSGHGGETGYVLPCHIMPPAPPGFNGNYCQYQLAVGIANCYGLPLPITP